MKSDVIMIDNNENGFKEAIVQTEKTAQYKGMGPKETLHLVLCTEEMLSLVHSITGDLKASFWLESENNEISLHITTETVMDREKREAFISSSTKNENDAANSFIGRLRDAFEKAMLSDEEFNEDLPYDILDDLVNRSIEFSEWDKYEQSILRRIADEIKISIVGKKVHMTVFKKL